MNDFALKKHRRRRKMAKLFRLIVCLLCRMMERKQMTMRKQTAHNTILFAKHQGDVQLG